MTPDINCGLCNRRTPFYQSELNPETGHRICKDCFNEHVEEGVEEQEYILRVHKQTVHIAVDNLLTDKTLCNRVGVPKPVKRGSGHGLDRRDRAKTMPFQGLGEQGFDRGRFCKWCVDRYRELEGDDTQ